MIQEPLYLDANEVRMTATASTDQLPEDMPMELKKLYMFRAMTDQKPEGYLVCEMGYLIDQVLFDCTFYVIFIKKDTVIEIIKPALDEGREVIIGDVDKKEYTISPSLYEKGFRRTKEDIYEKDGGWKNVQGEAHSLLAWANKKLFV